MIPSVASITNTSTSAPPGTASVIAASGAQDGVFLAASDFMKSVPEMIQRWVPGGLYTLGTDGFGRSETRQALRRHFEVDAECIAVAALSRLALRGEIKPSVVAEAIMKLNIDPEKANPMRV